MILACPQIWGQANENGELKMSRKTVSVSVSAKMDDLLAALAARYGSTKSGILNLILQRTLSADDGLKKLMSVELKQKDEKVIKRSYRINEELLVALKEYDGFSLALILEKAVAPLLDMDEPERQHFLFP